MGLQRTLPVLGFAILCASPLVAQAPPPVDVRDLRDVYARGFILEDRNEDDVTDFVRARIVLPAAPTDADVTSAANLAARLGYETAATDLNLASLGTAPNETFDVPVLLIGAHDALLSRAGASVPADLAPSQGAVTFLPAGDVFLAGAVHVSGYDATGTLAAADYLSARYPSVWAVSDGPSYTDVAERLELFLTQRDAAPDALTLDRIVVDAAGSGVRRLVVSASIADGDAFERAVTALAGRSSAVGAGPDSAAAPADAPADSAAAEASDEDEDRVRLQDLQFTDLHRIDLTVLGAARDTTLRLLPQRAWPEREPNGYNPGGSPDFTLSDLYTIRGLYRDTDQDEVPDRTDAYLSVNGAAGAASLVDLATRMGLETAGMRLPIARVAGQDDYPEAAGFPVLYGVGHYQTERLRTEGKLYGANEGAGVGFMEFVRGELGERNGLVISGNDEAGLSAITDYAAARLPYLWDPGKGNYRLADLETEVRRFVQAREGPGQMALALYKLDTWLDRLSDDPIDSISVEIAAKTRYEGLDPIVERMIQERFPTAGRSVETFETGFGVGKEIFTQEFEVPWEVDAFWEAFRAEALPRLGVASEGRIDVRVSESPEVRAEIEREIRAELGRRGVATDAFEVHVLSAYKQGYSWLRDDVLRELRGQPVDHMEIVYHTLRDSEEVRWQEIEAETRWLQEIFPVDAVLARELSIPDSAITFRATREQAPIYAVRAFDAAGSLLLHDTFDPKYVVRPFFDLFPEYEQVRVTTGWVTVEANGETLLDRRIKTDPEAFWDVLQTDTYAQLIEYVMDVQDGRPASGNAPYFDEFRVELSLSEPNYRIGVDEEVVSSVEALHEDIYFETLTLFSLLGQRYGVGAMNYPGRVLPYIEPLESGQAGRARITLTGKDRAEPEIAFTYREAGGEPVRRRYPLSPLGLDAPVLSGITARAGEEGLEQLLFQVQVTDSIDRYEEFRLRGSEQSIDRQFLSAPMVTGMLRMLGLMQQEGVAEDALAFDRVGEVALRVVIQDPDSVEAEFSSAASLPRSGRPVSTERPVLYADGFSYEGERLVQWDTPIPPAESDAIMAQLATFSTTNVYWVGRSFLGQDIYAVDFLPPHDASYLSQAKLNALRPTLVLSGRQHANEVSSTSHILRLGELLATDPDYTELLQRVNVVLHPITNPDGARLAYEMQLENPDFMLHAGYLGALGVDATSGANSDDPIYPEAKVRPELQDTWLPDIFMNLHGYPSHEWVQYFAGYSAWVRSRTGAQRSWWAPRGWFIPGYSYNEDDDDPQFQEAQMAILDTITAAIGSVPEVMEMNERMYARYAKYGTQEVEGFREYFHNDVLVYLSLRGGELSNNRRITYVSTTTEAPDETARGDWLGLVASAGLAHDAALVRYLATGVNEIEREQEEFEGAIMRKAARLKPVTPP